MGDVFEVQPDAVRPDQLEAFERALADAGGRVGSTARFVGRDGVETALPEAIHALLVSIIDTLKTGNGISVIPMHAELTTVEAAELLNISRPFLIKKIEAGGLPHHMAGTHRRLRLADVLAYRDRLDAEANNALAAMSTEAEDLRLYDQ